MRRFLLRFSCLALLAPATCTQVACVDSTDDPEVETVESAVSYPFCVDHPCPDLNVRVLKSNIFIQTATVWDPCTITGTGVLVGNHGTAHAGASTLKVMTASGSTKTIAIPALAPGYSFQVNTSVPQGGKVIVDANDNVAEGNESQNTYYYVCP